MKPKTKSTDQTPPPQTDPLADLIGNPLAQASLAVGRLRVAPESFSSILPDLVGQVIKNNEAIKKGDLTNLEELLYSQALVLDASFHKFLAMAVAATEQTALMNGRFEIIPSLLSMALKAQEQSRKTLIALAELKNPKPSAMFIKNYVDKQLNHNLDESPIPTQHQIEEDKREPMDTRSQRQATPADPELETVGEVNGTNQRRGKGSKRQEQHQARDEKC